jgi:hypothetical protein
MKKFLAAIAVIMCLMTASSIAKTQAQPQAQDRTIGGDMNGEWHFVLDTPGGDREIDANFAVDADGKVTGTFGKTSAVGTYKNGKMDLDFQMTAEESGETSQMKLVGKFDDPVTLSGNWQFSSYEGGFKATHTKK